MRLWLRNGSLLSAFTVAAVIGCNLASDAPNKPQAGNSATSASTTEAAANEYVLTVEGMT